MVSTARQTIGTFIRHCLKPESHNGLLAKQHLAGAVTLICNGEAGGSEILDGILNVVVHLTKYVKQDD
jgi:hypothetical protein